MRVLEEAWVCSRPQKKYIQVRGTVPVGFSGESGKGVENAVTHLSSFFIAFEEPGLEKAHKENESKKFTPALNTRASKH